jgi:hypothetical protein
LTSTEYIFQASGKCGAYVDSIQFKVRDFHTGVVRTIGPFGGTGGHKPFSCDAGDGKYVSAVHLRAGALIDAIAFELGLLPEK